jgi:hypothetical protein
MLIRSTRRLIADGLPEAPITFRAVNPAQPWQGLAFATNGSSGPRIEYCNFSGANIGVVSSDNTLYADNCIFDASGTGGSTGSGAIFFRKTQFTQNQIGADSHVFLNSISNPNSFENNAMAVAGTSNAVIDARNVWWNSPTGPRHPSNPGGTGELVAGPVPGNVQVIPFLTSRPDFANTPPVVRLTEPGIRWNGAQVNADYVLEPSSRYILRWEARDDIAIASQRVVLSGDGHYNTSFTITLAANLPPYQRSLEITVPNVGYAGANEPQFIRVIAVDESGQEGWDQTPCVIPSGRMSGSLTISNEADFAGLVFRPGVPIPDLHWTGSVSGLPTLDPMIVFESDGATVAALPFSGNVGMFFKDFPFVSTDRARLAIRARNNSNDVIWFYANSYFSIRHDERMNYSPPAVEVTSPTPGSSYPGGAIVPVAWTGAASEGFYAFDIQGSYDGGRTWHLIAQELPAAARSFSWRLPSSGGISDARVRLIARDLRFQNSADDAGFNITPGTFCRADYNGDGFVDGIDYDLFNNDFEAGNIAADYNRDGFVDGIDYDQFNNDFEAGC